MHRQNAFPRREQAENESLIGWSLPRKILSMDVLGEVFTVLLQFLV
jgi:hypothetical protein